MKKFICSIIFILFSSTAFSFVSLDSENGKKMLISSLSQGYADQFLSEVRYFVHQDNVYYCGVATATIILNTLQITPPKDNTFKGYEIFTQSNIFNETPSIVKQKMPTNIVGHGLTLSQEEDLFKLFSDVNVSTYFSNKLTEAEMKKIIVTALKSNKSLVVANILRSSLGQTGSGHFSPIVAYDPTTDSVLFLDVATYKYPPIWVTMPDLYSAMHTKDRNTDTYRGFLLISKV